jgi:N-acetylmuramoyl-L-alanine amidase
MKYNKPFIIAFLALSILGTPWLINSFPRTAYYLDNAFNYVDRNIATVFLNKPITISELQNKYNSTPVTKAKIRVLVMPGHEPNYGGAEYRDLKEREMTVELAEYLRAFLSNNPHYEVVVPRDKNGWNPTFQKFFDERWEDIVLFLKNNKNEMIRLVNNGAVTRVYDGVGHNAVPNDVAIRLYGINKWVNENKIDIAIHIHFNDYPRRYQSQPGKYNGFAIYVPERQYANSTTTLAIADKVFKRLAKYNAISNLPREDSGVVEEQELIAIGSHNTLDAPSMLIEYGYIYEPQFNDPKIKDATMKDLAFQTYLGLQDFFGGPNDISTAYDTLMLPYKWSGDITKDKSNKEDVLALQTALIADGFYPSKGKTKNDCPRTGTFGPCTIEALTNFQKIYDINNEKGKVGQLTKSVLNSRYSLQLK